MVDSSAKATHLIIVCCHAIYIGGPKTGKLEDNWSVARSIFQVLAFSFETRYLAFY